jgi:hypothetical protein
MLSRMVLDMIDEPRVTGKTRLLLLATLSLWGWGIVHAGGGVFMGVVLIADKALPMLNAIPAEVNAAPGLARLLVGVFAVWAGCIAGLGVEAMVLAHGAFRTGSRWAWLLVVFTLGPADLGAFVLGQIGQPGPPTSLTLPVGLSLFLGAALLSIPAVWFGDPPPPAPNEDVARAVP